MLTIMVNNNKTTHPNILIMTMIMVNRMVATKIVRISMFRMTIMLTIMVTNNNNNSTISSKNNK